MHTPVNTERPNSHGNTWGAACFSRSATSHAFAHASRGLSAIAEFLVLEVCVGSIIGTLPLSFDFSLDQNSLVAVDFVKKFVWLFLHCYFSAGDNSSEISHSNKKTMHNEIVMAKNSRSTLPYFMSYDTATSKDPSTMEAAATVAHAVTLTGSLTSDKLIAVAEVT